MKVLAIIPARGDSKSIPSKNIQKLGKLPLIAHTIESAKNSKEVNRIIVSTDNKKIAKIAEKYGAEVPFLRPKKFSRDSSSTLDVVQHAIQFLQKVENYTPDIITILLPTSPFRPPNLIDESVKLLKNTKATSVVSVHKTKTHPFKAFLPENGFLKPFKRDYQKYYQRQKLPHFYHTTGTAYTFWFNTLKKYGHYYGPRMKPLFSYNDEMNIDIDNVFDFFIAEMTLKYWKTYPKKFKSIL
ncbi:MAG: acylneuraminate cytidylyltransferase family protein [Thaumarchaeota archaeon]|nr:acylneuraminate cytidylyltransferase family protein [Nitrososphaerota archaeon]